MNFINDIQTPEERRAKYKDLKDHGASINEAQRYRDHSQSRLNRVVIPFLVTRTLKELQKCKQL